MKLKKNLSGKEFGKWFVIIPFYRNRVVYYICECKCGEVGLVSGSALTAGKSKSCGCSKIKHGQLCGYIKGGYKRSVNFKVWENIKTRVFYDSHPSHIYYRDLGIYRPWVDNFLLFDKYIKDNLGERPNDTYTIDRIDNDIGYFPGNLRWSDWKTQASNRRDWGAVT